MSDPKKSIISKDKKRRTQDIRLEKTLKQMPILVSNIEEAPQELPQDTTK